MTHLKTLYNKYNMRKGTFSDPSDHSSESKRRKILALTPPPDIFLFNSEEIGEQGKDLDLKLDVLTGKNEESSNLYSSTLGVTNCNSSGNTSLRKCDESSENLNVDKKQICDLDFFKLISEGEDDTSSNSVLNLFNGSRYFDMVQQNHQDTNMNDLRKELDLHPTKYDMGRSNYSGLKVPASSVVILGEDKKGQISSNNSHGHAKSSNLGVVARDKVNDISL